MLMRAKEFITEVKGKYLQRYGLPGTGTHIFSKKLEYFDRTYDLNRVMMAVASTDGEIEPNVYDSSWVGKNLTAHAYTDVEHKMLEKAFKAAGMEYVDLVKGDISSTETSKINVKSPIKPFKGYK